MLVQVVLAGDLNTASDNVDELHAVVTAGQGGDFTLQQTGTASLNRMGNELARSDMERAELFGVPLALVVLRRRLRRRAGRVHAAGAQHHQHRPGAGPRRPHRPGLPHAHLRPEHRDHTGSRRRHRLHPVHHQPLSGRARPRPREDRRHRRHRRHRQPRHLLQRHDGRPRHVRHGRRPGGHHDQHGHRRDGRRLHDAAQPRSSCCPR